METIIIDGNTLTIEEIIAVARRGAKVEIAVNAIEAINQSRERVDLIMAQQTPVYGINTGFGIFSEQKIPCKDAVQLSRNLILSHAVGTGRPLDKEVVRAAMLVRANTLAKGFSGVRLIVVETLLALLNKNVTPLVPSQGSLGSSGDLAPLSHMALVFTTDANDLDEESSQAYFEDEILSGKAAMARAKIRRIILEAKEGLALNNGATFSAAIAALAIYDAETLLNTANVSLAMTLEAVMGCSAAFDERLHHARGHKGQIKVAEAVRELTKYSGLIDCRSRVQDAYSLRCAPQVQGIAWDTMEFARDIVEEEINAATDNPLIFDSGNALSGGNFHGEPVGLVMDFLGVALAEIGSISERRTFRLLDGHLNADLPQMLVDNPEAAGLNSGLMMPQYTAASLVLENQGLAAPDSVHSLPTSAEQEDHNANSMTAARHTREILLNTAYILAIEVYTATRALYFRKRDDPRLNFGAGTAQAYEKVREKLPYRAGDAWWGPEIDVVYQMILAEELVITWQC